MERRWLCDNKPILAKSTLHTFEEGETNEIILRDANLEQSDIEVISENFAYATYLDLSYNKKIVLNYITDPKARKFKPNLIAGSFKDGLKASLKFLLTPTTLYLRDCSSVHDIIYRFTTCTLKNLDIAGCAIDYEEQLTKYDFPVLENLTLTWKPNIEWPKMLSILEALKVFQIYGICSDTYQGLEELLAALAAAENIKSITFGGIPSDFEIGLLKTKMVDRQLSFHLRNSAASHMYRLHNLQNLRAIYLEHSSEVTNADLLQLIMNCPNLTKITLDYCHGITKDFIFKATEFLRERDKAEPLKARFNLEICGCAGITEDIQEDPLYAKAESAISLILFFKCKYPNSSYRNDLIIPYPPPNVQLSIYILFEIYRKLIHSPAAQRFATVCEDFENAAIEEERHLKIIACRKAKILNNDIYDAYLEITMENNEFFTELKCTRATKMDVSNRILTLDTIFDDFPQLRRLKLLNCVLYEEELPRNKSYGHISDLEICGGNAFRVWQMIAILFPHVETVALVDALLENPLAASEPRKPRKVMQCQPFENVSRLTIIGSILRDEDIKFLRHLTHLKILAVCGNSQLTGKYISELSSIEELQLKSCENLMQYYLTDILSALTLLKSLDIRDSVYAFVSAHLTNAMWLPCECLRVLKINWQKEHTITTLQIVRSLVDLEVRNFRATACAACQQHERAISEVPNTSTHYEQCTCSAEMQTHLEKRFFRTLVERTTSTPPQQRITRLTLEAELLSRNINYLQLLQGITHLSVIAKRSELDAFRISPDFYRSIGELRNLEYLYLYRFYYCFDGIIHIVGRCANLREIRLKECVGFSDVVVYDLCEVLRRKRVKDQLPLFLYMMNAKDCSSDGCSEACSSSASDEVNRFEDVEDFIKVIFM